VIVVQHAPLNKKGITAACVVMYLRLVSGRDGSLLAEHYTRDAKRQPTPPQLLYPADCVTRLCKTRRRRPTFSILLHPSTRNQSATLNFLHSRLQHLSNTQRALVFTTPAVRPQRPTKAYVRQTPNLNPQLLSAPPRPSSPSKGSISM